MAGSSAALWPTETHSTSLERSKPPLLTQALFKSLEALLMYFISVQSTLISIVFISKGAVFVGPICIWFVCLPKKVHFYECVILFTYLFQDKLSSPVIEYVPEAQKYPYQIGSRHQRREKCPTVVAHRRPFHIVANQY